MGAFDFISDKAKKLAALLADSASTGATMYSQANAPADPELTKGVLGFLPGVGDAISGYDAYDSARQGNYGEAALNAAGVIPGVPSLAPYLKGAGAIGVGMIKGPMGRIPETGAEARKLSEILKRSGEKAGYVVSHNASAISPSQYVTFTRTGNDSEDITRQVRLSNHADKYPELADGVRTSVDPSTEISFEQAVNWLKHEGFPTALSSKYKNIPSWDEYYKAKRLADALPENRLQKLQTAWLNQPKATRGPKPTIDDVK